MDYKKLAECLMCCAGVNSGCICPGVWNGIVCSGPIEEDGSCMGLEGEASKAITDLLTRAETAEARLAKAQEELDKMEQLHEDARLKLGKAMDDLRGMCWCCANARKWDAAPGWSSAVTCKHMSEAGITGGCGRAGKKCEHWEWKGDKHGEFETTDR